MADVLQEVVAYLEHAIGLTVVPEPWAPAQDLPPFLRDRYAICAAEFGGTPCLLMVDRHVDDVPPATVRKHLDQLHKRWGGLIVYVRRAVAAYNRKRLIEQRVPFIVPGNQMYLAPLGIDLREHFCKLQAERSNLRPSSQAALVHMLLHEGEDFGLTDLAFILSYSAMTVSRAMDELEVLGLADTYSRGRERRLRLTAAKRDIWLRSQPYLRDPVQRRHWARCLLPGPPPGPSAGLSALAAYSNLAEPYNAVIALSRDEWRAKQQYSQLHDVEAAEPDAIRVEVWTYPPALLANERTVDQLSLYLSLRESEDERVEAALESMMGDIRW